MAILGIETLTYGVDDVALCTRYFEDFGLPLLEQSAGMARFRLEEGSNVIIRHITDPVLPASKSKALVCVKWSGGLTRRRILSVWRRTWKATANLRVTPMAPSTF